MKYHWAENIWNTVSGLYNVDELLGDNKHHKNTKPRLQYNIPIYKDWYVEENG
jgi:hypothetical protein